jgi:large subunit ribosomal protein L17
MLKKARKFGRTTDIRKALLRGLALSLIEKGRIKTTEAKAKSVRPMVEKIITAGKKETLAARRQVLRELYNNEKATGKVFKEIAPKYAGRAGGYTRILKLPRRPSDAAREAIIEFV